MKHLFSRHSIFRPNLTLDGPIISILFLFASIGIVSGQGELWGVTSTGGVNDLGVIFKTNAEGAVLEVKKSFNYSAPGKEPFNGAQLLQVSNGKFYGMTPEGGANSKGVLFEYDPASNIYEVKYNFEGTTGSAPSAGLSLHTNGKLYGMTRQGGANNGGVIFEYDFVTNSYIKKYDFPSTGSGPYGKLVTHSNGKMYGLSLNGGASFAGTLFEYDPLTNVFTTKQDFDNTGNGANPYGDLIEAGNGLMYGLAQGGGSNSKGTLFEYDPVNNTLTKKFDFNTSDGTFPPGSLVAVGVDKFYGITGTGGANNAGVVFEYNYSTNTFSKKKDFGVADGANATGSLTLGSDGDLYGMTSTGGTFGDGTIFKYNISGNSITKVHEFDNAADVVNGFNPRGNLVQATNGKLYGMTRLGGAGSGGVLFAFDHVTNDYSKRIDFSAKPDGSYPYNGLVQFSDTQLFGLTSEGGNHNAGVLYEYDLSDGSFVKHFDFEPSQGTTPKDALVKANDKLYGLTQFGGQFGRGVLFEFDPVTSAYVRKYDFDNLDGNYPRGSMTLASNDKLYGMTNTGGTNDGGVIFEYDPVSGGYTKKWDFDPLECYEPTGHLIQASNGKLYGITEYGGVNDEGALFEFDILSHSLAVKVSFAQGYPTGSLIQATNGKLYGMASQGGLNDEGFLFEYDFINDVFNSKVDFDGAINGSSPNGGLIQSTNGKLYGLTTEGGAGNFGVLFEYDPITNSYVKKFDFDGTKGSTPYYTSMIFVKSLQSITFDDIDDKNQTSQPFIVSAIATSGLPVTYATSSSKITLSGNQVTVIAAGRVSITANQSGDNNYSAAIPVEKSFCINPSKPLVTFSSANVFESILTSSSATGNQWYLNGTPIGGATSATHQVSQEGIYAVKVGVDDCESEFSDEMAVVVTGDINQGSDFVMAYPNPVSNILSLNLGHFRSDTPVDISIIDLLGRIRYFASHSVQERPYINLENLPGGRYIIRAQQLHTVVTKSIIKK